MREGYKMTKLGEIPIDWEVVKFGEVTVNLDNIRKPIKSSDRNERSGIYPYYGAQGIIDYIDGYLFEGVYLLIAEDGENVKSRKYDIALIAEGKFWVNNHAHVVRSNSRSNIKYLKYFINKLDIRPYITGLAQPKLNKGALNNLNIVLPPLQEQKKIAEILSTVDEKIDLVQSNIEATQALKKGLMQQLLTKGIGHTTFKASKLGEIPLDWEVVRLERMGKGGRPVIKAGPFGSSLKKEFYVSKGYKIYGQEQVIRNDPFYGNYFINEKKFLELKSCEVFYNDILLSLVGTIGKVLVIPQAAPKGIINPRLLRISVDSLKYSSTFLAFYLQSMKTIKTLNRWSQGGIMGVLNAGMLKKLPVPLPPLQEQKKIAEILSTVDEKLDILQEKKAAYQAMKKGLMQQLLTGQVRVQ